MNLTTLDIASPDMLARLSALAVHAMLICVAMSVLVVMMVEFLKPSLRLSHNERCCGRGWRISDIAPSSRNTLS